MATTTLNRRIPPKRILVVEDDLLVAHGVRMALAVDGHTVEIAPDGEQGLARFKQGKHDLVIADFILPKVDGLELAQAIKEMSPQSPIILITAHADEIKSSMGKVSNIDLLLHKPFSVSELQAALLKLFPPTP
jgi:DNA-binding response OmpR family regulator